MKKLEIRLKSLAHLDALTKTLKIWLTQLETKKVQKTGTVFALIGHLGAGKTALAKSLIKQAGIRKKITSPTFVLMNVYPDKKSKKVFYHLDTYRTRSFKDLAALGIEEIWQNPRSIVLIEWADKIKSKLPPQTIYIYMRTLANGSHSAKIANAPTKLQKMLKLIKA